MQDPFHYLLGLRIVIAIPGDSTEACASEMQPPTGLPLHETFHTVAALLLMLLLHTLLPQDLTSSHEPAHKNQHNHSVYTPG